MLAAVCGGKPLPTHTVYGTFQLEYDPTYGFSTCPDSA